MQHVGYRSLALRLWRALYWRRHWDSFEKVGLGPPSLLTQRHLANGAIALATAVRAPERTENKNDFLTAITQLAAEKNLPKEVVFEAVEAALASAFKKDALADADLQVRIDGGNGGIRVFQR